MPNPRIPKPEPRTPLLFSRPLIRQRRNRAATARARHGALAEEVEAQLLDRLAGFKDEFRSVLELGTYRGGIGRHFRDRGAFAVTADAAAQMLPDLVMDEEYLPFAENSFDLIAGNLTLQWVNDLPGALLQIRRTLKPGGVFLAALAGGASLYELRACLMEAELALTGGAAARVSPMIDMATASQLLQRAGFTLPVTDQEPLTLTYPDALALMRELRGMGATNATTDRPRRMPSRRLFAEAARLYRERFGAADGRVPATFEILFLHGRKPENPIS